MKHRIRFFRWLITFIICALPSYGAAQTTTVTNCGVTQTFDRPPSRVITLNQHATELLLALGLEERIIGTAFLDDSIAPRYQAAYQQIPVLAKRYPSREVILASGTDFVFAGFKSGFGKQVAGDRKSLQARGIQSYLTSSECLPKNKPASLDLLYHDIRQLGAIFHVDDDAEALIKALQQQAEPLTKPRGTGTKALLFDSGDKTAFSAGCCGTAAAFLTLLGLENIGSAQIGAWTHLSWEAVLAADPDVIVLVDANWSSSEAKRHFLQNHSVLKKLRAVREERFITLPFSATVLGVHFIQHAVTARKQVKTLLGESDQ